MLTIVRSRIFPGISGLLATSLVIGLLTAVAKPADAEEPGGLDRLAGEETPLVKGERIVFFGDSITAAGANPGGYVTRIADSLKKGQPDLGVAILGAGISGHKVPDLQKRLQRDVLNKKTGKRYATIPLPASRQAIIDAGGLIPYTRQRLLAGK